MSSHLDETQPTNTYSPDQPRLAGMSDKSMLDQILDAVQTIESRSDRPSTNVVWSFEEIERFAERAAISGMVPTFYVNKPDAIIIAVQMGFELGLPPIQALQNIAVINGRPAVWGDATPGLCWASGKVEYIKEYSRGEGDNLTYYCEAKRKNNPVPSIGQFSVADAIKAGLWQTSPKVEKRRRDGQGTYTADNDSPWWKYPKRMLLWRARGYGLRDAFPDVLRGLISAEEAMDMREPAEPPLPAKPETKTTLTTSLDRLEQTLDAERAGEVSGPAEKVSDEQTSGTVIVDGGDQSAADGTTQTSAAARDSSKPLRGLLTADQSADVGDKLAAGSEQPAMTVDGKMPLRQWVISTKLAIQVAGTDDAIKQIETADGFLDNLASVEGLHKDTADDVRMLIEDRKAYVAQLKK